MGTPRRKHEEQSKPPKADGEQNCKVLLSLACCCLLRLAVSCVSLRAFRQSLHRQHLPSYSYSTSVGRHLTSRRKACEQQDDATRYVVDDPRKTRHDRQRQRARQQTPPLQSNQTQVKATPRTQPDKTDAVNPTQHNPTKLKHERCQSTVQVQVQPQQQHDTDSNATPTATQQHSNTATQQRRNNIAIQQHSNTATPTASNSNATATQHRR